MGKKTASALNIILSVAVAAVLLWFSFRGVDWHAFRQALESCSWSYVLLSMGFGVLSFWLRGLRWRMLLLPIDGTTARLTTFNAVNIGYVVNMVLPRAGELVRCGYITRHSALDGEGRRKASYDKVFGTVVVDRLWDVLSLGLLLVGTLALLWDRFGPFFSEKVFAPLAERLGGSAGGLLLGLGVLALLFAGAWLVWRLRERSRLCGRIWGFVAGIGKGISGSLRLRHGGLFIVYTAFIWVCYWMMSYTIIWAVRGMDFTAFGPAAADIAGRIAALGPADALFLMLVGSVSTLVPVPGGFGAFHYMVSLSLTVVYGIPSSVGIVFATLSHESQILIESLCGLGSYAVESLPSSLRSGTDRA